MNIRNISILGFGLLLVASCGNNDKVKPTLTVSSPADNFVVESGSAFDLILQAYDNKDLSQFKIEIHNDYNGHSHKSTYTPFSKTIIENITGTEIQKTINIAIPDTAGAGPYHMTIQAVDMMGNLSELVVRSFKIKNLNDTIQPTLNVTAPLAGTSFAKGASIQLTGTINDNLELQKLDYYIVKEGSDNKLFEASEIFTGTAQSFNLSIPLTASTFASGEYELIIVVYDKVYNSNYIEVHFEVQ